MMRRAFGITFYMMIGVMMIGVAGAFSAAEGQSGAGRPDTAVRAGVSAGGVAAVVRGVAFDSLAMRPFSAATVQLVPVDGGSSQTVASDSVGRFEFAEVAAGAYLIGFFHPKLDSLGINAPVTRLEVRGAEPVRVTVAIPSAGTLVRSVCGERSTTDSTGLMLGFIRGADDAMPRGAGRFSVRWVELILTTGGLRRETPTIEGQTGPTGLVVACGIPIDSPVLVQAEADGQTSGLFEVTVPPSGLLHRDVFVGRADRVQQAAGDSVSAAAGGPPVAELLRGRGRLRGTVMGANGRPLRGARVAVWGTGLEALTDAQGVFSLASLPAGTHTLEVRAVGFEPARRAIDITETGSETDVALASLGIRLETVRVVAERVYVGRRMADFERRRRAGWGKFLDDRDIEKRNPAVLTDLLRMMPGVQVVPGRTFGEDVFMRGGPGLGTGYCRPDILVDGVRMMNDEMFPFNSMVPVQQVYAIEVYAHAPTVPPEFSSMSGCGAIVIWTGQRSKLP